MKTLKSLGKMNEMEARALVALMDETRVDEKDLYMQALVLAEILLNETKDTSDDDCRIIYEKYRKVFDRVIHGSPFTMSIFFNGMDEESWPDTDEEDEMEEASYEIQMCAALQFMLASNELEFAVLPLGGFTAIITVFSKKEVSANMIKIDSDKDAGTYWVSTGSFFAPILNAVTIKDFNAVKSRLLNQEEEDITPNIETEVIIFDPKKRT